MLRGVAKYMNQGRGIRMTWKWRTSFKQVIGEFLEEVAFVWRPK